jgi:DNA polymerase III subunit delta'
LRTLLIAAGGRPADALAWARSAPPADVASAWTALPAAMMRGDVSALADWPPAEAIVTLQKLCHDAMAMLTGAEPRFFTARSLAALTAPGGKRASLGALTAWAKELAQGARTAEHPYNPGLMTEHLVSRARLALTRP